MFRRNGPGANVARIEPSPLERELVVVVPVFSASPQACTDCLPLFPACSFAVEGDVFVIEPHVIEIDVSMGQKSEWVDCISGPETGGMVGWIIEIVRVVERWSGGK